MVGYSSTVLWSNCRSHSCTGGSVDMMEKSRLSRLMYLYTEAGVGQTSQTRPQAQVQYRRRCLAAAPHQSLQVAAARQLCSDSCARIQPV